ncbi:Major facilitator superfamily domain general substrate transporter [Penicillium expansum]|nr:Major facilitator superfamily domain general substrate transporter [Penicillium expansum]
MPSHIKFAEPTSNKASKDRARAISQEKGSTQRAPSPGSEIVYPTGWRLMLTTTGLLIGFFLSNLDVTIVSSALTGITDDLKGFEKRSWIITGYLATYTGPIIGGALAEDSAWRWTFFVNAPLCVIAIVVIIFAMPKHFGLDQHTPSFRTRASYRSFANLDIMGSILMMAGSFLIVAVLNETNLAFSWSSRDAIALLVLTGVSWIAFFAWEWYISGIPGKDPIFPKRWLFDRPWLGILISSFVIGAPYNVVLVYVPQQAQLLLDKSPLDAGIYLIGYSAIAAVAAAIVNIASSRGRIPFVYTLLVGCTVHTVGIGLLSTIATSRGFHAADIGYLVIAGTGMGLTMGILVLSTPYIVEDRDLGMCSPEKFPDIEVIALTNWSITFVVAIATGTVVQIRFLGGAIGLAIASNILNGRLAKRLRGVMTSHELHLFLENVKSIKSLSPSLQEEVKSVLASSFNTQLLVMIGFAAAQLPATLLLLKAGRQLAASKHSGTNSG